jgi:hypothetical protein
MLSNTKLNIPDRKVYIIHKERTLWGINMARSHGTTETISRIMCFNNKCSADICIKYLNERFNANRYLKVFEIQLSDMYSHCKYHNMGFMVCNDNANIKKIIEGDVNFTIDTEEVIDPLTSWDEQLNRLENCYVESS